MNYWIFIVTDKQGYSARKILIQRIEDNFWGLGDRTPNRQNLEIGDAVVFYVGFPERVFAGTARLASPSFQLSEKERRKLSHGNSVFDTEYGIRLKDGQIWETPLFVPDLIDQLSFVENRTYWGSYFQGGIRGISEDDYSIIISSAKGTFSGANVRKSEDEIESTAEFALEAHLEEFIFANWDRINWERSLRLYETEDSSGRQFPAGTWSIDFLAIDNLNNDLVVIELKRGQTGDATVGQVLRYMGWVRKNIAQPEQKVRGIIICREVDDSLKYAVSQTRNISVLTYRVNFQLNQEQI